MKRSLILTEKGGVMKKMISTLRIDLAKNTFQLCALTRRGEVIFNKKVARRKIFSEIEKFDKAKEAMALSLGEYEWPFF